MPSLDLSDIRREHIVLIIVMVIFTGIYLYPTYKVVTFEVPEIEHPPEIQNTQNKGLSIEEIYFLKSTKQKDENTTQVSAQIYLTNKSKVIEEVKVETLVINTSLNLAKNKTITTTETFPANKTKIIKADITIPTLEKQYKVDFLIFENDLLTLKGSGKIGVSKEKGKKTIKIGDVTWNST